VRDVEEDNGSMEPRVLTLPEGVEMFFDTRGTDRCLRTAWHHEEGLLVVSLWRDSTCVGAVRLQRDEVPRLLEALSEGLAASPERQSAWGEAS
jgi:hypothetical protein